MPAGFDRFETVHVSVTGHGNFPDMIVKCPACGTCFYRTRRIDNEILHNSDEVEFNEITEERVREIRRYQENEIKNFSARIDQKLAEKKITLAGSEEAVIGVFKRRMREQLSFHEIRDGLEPGVGEDVQAILDALVGKKALERFDIHTITYYSI